MAPKDYIQADQDAPEDDENYRVTVDGHPYMPRLIVKIEEESSIRQAVASLLKLEVSNNGNSWKVTKITGGITNQLFRVAVKDKYSVLVRVFGAEGMIDRNVENSTYAALSDAGLAPPYLGRFANGRLEAWLEGARPLEIRELSHPHYSTCIARQMGKFHQQFVVPPYLKEYHHSSPPALWSQLESWMTQALAAQFQCDHDTARAQALDLASIQMEIAWLYDKVVPRDAEVAFCHNDVLAANILFLGEKNDIQLIDFEYGGVNFCAFDVANHFNEFAGGTDDGIPNYDWFPSVDFQKEFLKYYLRGRGADPTPERVVHWWHEVQAFVMVNHLYWGLWGVNQAAMEGCQDFDYLLYASNRIQQYYKCKQESEEEFQ